MYVHVLIVKLGGKLPSQNLTLLLLLWRPFQEIWSCFCLYLYTDMTIFVYLLYDLWQSNKYSPRDNHLSCWEFINNQRPPNANRYIRYPSKIPLLLLILLCMHESDFTPMYTCYMTYGKARNTYPETTFSAAENSSTTNNPPTGMQSDTPLTYPCFCLFFY